MQSGTSENAVLFTGYGSDQAGDPRSAQVIRLTTLSWNLSLLRAAAGLVLGGLFDRSRTAFASSRNICALTRATKFSLTSMSKLSSASTTCPGVACIPSRASMFLIALRLFTVTSTLISAFTHSTPQPLSQLFHYCDPSAILARQSFELSTPPRGIFVDEPSLVPCRGLTFQSSSSDFAGLSFFHSASTHSSSDSSAAKSSGTSMPEGCSS